MKLPLPLISTSWSSETTIIQQQISNNSNHQKYSPVDKIIKHCSSLKEENTLPSNKSSLSTSSSSFSSSSSIRSLSLFNKLSCWPLNKQISSDKLDNCCSTSETNNSYIDQYTTLNSINRTMHFYLLNFTYLLKLLILLPFKMMQCGVNCQQAKWFLFISALVTIVYGYSSVPVIDLHDFGYLSSTPMHNEYDNVNYLDMSQPPYLEFGVAPGVLHDQDHSGGFDYRDEYSPKLANIYSRYLKRPSVLTYDDVCSLHKDVDYGNYVDHKEIISSFHKAGIKIEEYERANQEYLISDPRGLNFSAYVYVATLHSKYNEYVTKILKNKKCLTRKTIATELPLVDIPPNPWKKQKYCEMESSISLTTYCHMENPYRRIDGKCNNLVNTNLGSSFHCHRRLMPPDYSDGIHQIRLGVDNKPLPSPRLVTQLLMPDFDLNDPTLSALHFAWGQFLVHDTFRTIQNLGLAIDCCRLVNPATKNQVHSSTRIFYDAAGNKIPIPHPECLPITNFIPNKATEMFNQLCLNTVRSIACNTCSLGPRNQMNAATQVIDLSHLYGGNLINNSESLRTFIRGQMLTDFAKNGEIRMVPAGPKDGDTLDLTPCNPPLNNPFNVGCFRTGDGIRGNQNPFIASLLTMVIKRHNFHAAALHLVNPHWSDERLFQEARKITIAEVTKIHYDEYLPLLLGKRLMKYFHLEVRSHGYTKYNPNVDPSTIHAVGVAALRIGHSQTRSLYKVLYDHRGKTQFMLKDRFFNMIEVWKGQVTPVIRGLMAEPSKNVDPYGVVDIKDFLFFNPRNPSVIDLFSINVNRGRDHGVAAYVYWLQYCTGFQVTSWRDLEKFIPSNKVHSLKKVYRHYRDIDLFVGGLMEYHVKGSKVGPTYACLIGIQFYHWKYGDRFYFEHGEQAGSFTQGQLQEIRSKSSMANLICKTTKMDFVPLSPLEETSSYNHKIPCANLIDYNYDLWQEAYASK